MPAISQPRSLIDRQAFVAAALLELGIAFLMLAFQVFSFWLGLEAYLVLLSGFGFSWLIALGFLSLLGRRRRFPWLFWMLICFARGAAPALAMTVRAILDDWPADPPFGGDNPRGIICTSPVLPSIFHWGGAIWAMLGGLAYGSTWEHGLWGSRSQPR